MYTHRTVLFASFDTESDGNNPMESSLIALGVAMFEEDPRKEVFDTFYVNIVPRADAIPHPLQVKFWSDHPDQYLETKINAVTPNEAMQRFSDWLKRFENFKIKFVSSCASADFMWLKVYYECFGPPDKYPLGFYSIDSSSYLRAFMLMQNVRDEEAFLQSLAPGDERDKHHALRDAILQGQRYIALRRRIDNVSSARKVKYSLFH